VYWSKFSQLISRVEHGHKSLGLALAMSGSVQVA